MRALLVAALALLPGVVALAAPPPDGSEDAQILGPYSAQITQAHRDDHPAWSCCSMADGAAVDTQIVGDHWQVRFRNGRFADAPKGWVDVPPQTVLRGWTNPTIEGIAWWYDGSIRCFAPPGGV